MKVEGENGSHSHLHCVCHRSDGGACASRIAPSIATAAWRLQLMRDGARSDGFFRFTWNGGAWLAYGLSNGRVCGVYCPAHSLERNQRSFVADSRANEQTAELAVCA
jgi:hypothetical protein